MYKKELNLAICAVKAAANELSNRTHLFIDSAHGKDVKLSADKESERVIFSVIQSESQYPILSEEAGEVGVNHESGYRWIIDPLDGTANYLRGMTELTCVSVALWKENTPVLGVVYRYAANELYYGAVGVGAYCNGSPLAPSGIKLVKHGVMATGFPVHRDYSTESLQAFVRNVQRFKKVRMLGAAAIMGTLVAAGKIDVYLEENIMLWDVAAAAAIVQAAGGCVSIQFRESHMCICRLFANTSLMEDFDAESI